jgi:hypothetical protein
VNNHQQPKAAADKDKDKDKGDASDERREDDGDCMRRGLVVPLAL